MQRACDSCDKQYEAKLSTSRFCSTTCRARNTKAGSAPKPERPKLPGDLLGVTRRELEVADRLDTVIGQQALVLAARVASEYESGASVASLSRELRAVMAEALADVTAAADPMDELAGRRGLKASA